MTATDPQMAADTIAQVTRRSLSALRAICPQCHRDRFIPRYTAPYCTPSCRRDAACEAAAAEAAAKKEPGVAT